MLFSRSRLLRSPTFDADAGKTTNNKRVTLGCREDNDVKLEVRFGTQRVWCRGAREEVKKNSLDSVKVREDTCAVKLKDLHVCESASAQIKICASQVIRAIKGTSVPSEHQTRLLTTFI